MTKTHWKKLTNPNYIGAYSLEEGQELVVTIDRVVREQVAGPDGKKEECTVAHLKGQKPFILNATNQKTIQKVCGSPYIEDWSGKSITLYVAKVKAFGEVVDALRVRDKAPEKPALTQSHKSWASIIKNIASGQYTVEQYRSKYSISQEVEQVINDAVNAVRTAGSEVPNV